MSDQQSEYTQWDIEVAKRIACAVVSYQAGVPYEELWEQYVDQNEDVGTYWLSLAKQIRNEFPHNPKLANHEP
jgi:hypothetical protein